MRRIVHLLLAALAVAALNGCHDPRGDYYGDAMQPGERFDLGR